MPTETLLRRPWFNVAMTGAVAFCTAVALLGAARGHADPAPEPLNHWPTGTVQVTGKHPVRTFRVWLANTDARREQGLMYVRAMEPDQGMWFQFETPDILNFWMKNTFIPLDILYIASDGKVVRIADHATPFSLSPIPSGAPAIAVLELGGGIAEQMGIKVGDHATFHSPTR
jgi:uncharacterized membrane protein (UPF0127 family)